MSREGGYRITSRASAEEYKLSHVIDSELATTGHHPLPLSSSIVLTYLISLLVDLTNPMSLMNLQY
ncbi:unnamed protein product [Penicillium camemberti]|uniref:Str. FM013 n=1 Tax=Penicillium camemberti (strain FM 013) TaxID=1429867 RepID=A0A0G4NZB2_PENC3|nr:unnamed protein product [Penicillium camemberti]